MTHSRSASSTPSSSAPAAPACAPRCSSRAAGLNVAVLSKVFPTRSHTVAAQGGIGASLGNMSEDNWHWHMYDTVKGSDWLGDQDAIEFMCREAPKVVYELEHFGMPFDRNPRRHDLPAPVRRPHRQLRREAGAARLRRGRPHRPRDAAHAVPAQRASARTQFFVEWMALDLIRDADGDVLGVTALEMETGEVHDPAGQGHAARHRRRRAHLRRVDQRLHQHRRRPRHGGARRHPARGHGVLAVPPDRRGRRRRADHRRRARRGRRSCSTATASASWSATRRR